MAHATDRRLARSAEAAAECGPGRSLACPAARIQRSGAIASVRTVQRGGRLSRQGAPPAEQPPPWRRRHRRTSSSRAAASWLTASVTLGTPPPRPTSSAMHTRVSCQGAQVVCTLLSSLPPCCVLACRACPAPICCPALSQHPATRLPLRPTADHYTGLSDSWSAGPIYCSPITARLTAHMLGVAPRWLVPLPLDTPTMIQGGLRWLDGGWRCHV